MHSPRRGDSTKLTRHTAGPETSANYSLTVPANAQNYYHNVTILPLQKRLVFWRAYGPSQTAQKRGFSGPFFYTFNWRAEMAIFEV
jgi:hypothetical protein